MLARPRLVCLAALLAAAGCSRPDAQRAGSGDASSGFRGVVVDPPRQKPDFAFLAADGKPFDFRARTEGKVALLFFGYTHCPDVCPLHVANVAAVLKRMPFDEREAIRFVFVTTDPKRDTPSRLAEWLGNFDPSFIGLTAPVEEVDRLLYSLRMPPIQKDPMAADSAAYLVGHAAQVLAFGTDGLGRIEYPFGIRQEDWAHDLPRLARGEVPVLQPTAGANSAPGDPESPDGAGVRASNKPSITITTAVVAQPATASEAALYVVIRNDGGEDTLTSAASELAARAELHGTDSAMTGSAGGMRHMSALRAVVIPAGETVRLAPGDRHVMLFQLSRKPLAGETVPVRLRFARAGEYIFGANVAAYEDVERALGGR